MLAITSLSPGHKNKENQSLAIQSWVDNGINVVSINGTDEIEQLKTQYEVQFIPTFQTMERNYGKPYVSINAMLDFCKALAHKGEEKDFILINSDIILKDAKDVLKKYFATKCNEGVAVCKRQDYSAPDFSDAHEYEFGMDMFLLKDKWLDIYPQSLYCMGQTWWDYWIPFRAIRSNVKVFMIKEKIAYHKQHDIQYNEAEWKHMTNFFQFENSFHYGRSTPGRITSMVYNEIMRNAL